MHYVTTDGCGNSRLVDADDLEGALLASATSALLEPPTPERVGDWLHTIRGPFWPLDPRPEEIHIEVIARGCAGETRFGNQGGFYSVAQHCIYVSEIVPPPYRLWALLHDAPEGLGLKDIPRPVKRHLGFAYQQAESWLMENVCRRFKLEINHNGSGMLEMPDAVHRADETLLVTEARDLFGVDNLRRWDSLRGIEPLPEKIIPWTWQEAERRFLERFAELSGC